MGYIPPDLRDGDEWTLDDWNSVLAELRRLNKLRGTGQIQVRNANNDAPPIVQGVFPQPFTIRLTGVGDANGYHKWEEVYYGPDANGTYTLVTTGCKSDNNTVIDQAREVNGLRCPQSDEVYYAWRDWQGVVTFKAVRHLAVAAADINAGVSGNAYLWSVISNSETNSSTVVTAYNWNNNTKVTSGKRLMLTPVANRWYIDYEAC